MRRILLFFSGFFLCLSVWGQSQDIYINAGFRKFEEGEYATALLYMNRAVHMNPGIAKGYYQRAILKSKNGDYKQAMSDLDTALLKEPSYTPIYFLRSRLYAKIGQKEMAIRDISRYIHQNPRDLNGYEWKIELLLSERSDRSALITAEDMVNNNPDLALSWKTRGLLKEAQLDGTGAISDYSHCLSLSPGDSTCRIRRAGLAFEMGDMKTAVQDYRLFLAQYREFPDYWVNVSEALAVLKDTLGAVNVLDTAINYSANDPNLYMMRGYYKLSLKQYASAEADYSLALNFKTDEKPVLWFNRGLCYFYMKNLAGACEDWKLSAEANPPLEEAQKWLKKYCK